MNKTTLAQLTLALEQLELPKNHVYIVHSSMLKFGIVEDGLVGIMKSLTDVLGENSTILMPTFTFSFGRSRLWDYSASKSEVGALTEYFRKLPDVIRTVHPFHSVAAKGRLAPEFASCSNLSSFGEGSPFDLLYKMDAFNIALGTEFEGGATFLHHTEETARVPYRFYKDFPGDVSFKDGRKSPKTYKMFVREIAETYEWDNKWDPVWEDFVNDGLVTQQVLNGANLFALPIKPTHDRFLKRLIADPCYCANKISR